MKNYQYLLILFYGIVLSGCGTFLSVGETTIENENPNGIVVNKRVIYEATVTSKSARTADENSQPIKITTPIKGIDNKNLLVINGSRMIFSSGHLAITLTEDQLTSQVSITSETGAIKAAEAANTAVGTFKEATKKPPKE